MNLVRSMGRSLMAAAPMELAIGNIVRRVLYTIREEVANMNKEAETESSLQNILDEVKTEDAGPVRLELSESHTQGELRNAVIDGINEIMGELENLHEPIAIQALEHIHTNEVILTVGRSRTVEEFFKAAAKKRHFEVIVAESAPSFTGQDMAVRLAAANVPTTVITDAAVFGMMARVNKVVIPTHAVMANGGVLVQAGGHAVALAAKHHSVPLVCVTGLYKLCPLYPHDQDTFNDLQSPSPVLSLCAGGAPVSSRMDEIDVVNPGYDYIPPELVSLFITNFNVVPSLPSGGHQPSYIYRLLSEYYSPEDVRL